MRVLCLTCNLYDRNTKIRFEPCTPVVVKTETDQYGHVYEYMAHGTADIDPTDTVMILDEPVTLADYFRSRNKTHLIVEKPDHKAVGPAFTVDRRAGPWFDVLNAAGEKVNDKALKRADADEYAAKLNAEGD